MSDNEGNAVATWLGNHPRLMGVLFAALLTISQAGSALAAGAGSIAGP